MFRSSSLLSSKLLTNSTSWFKGGSRKGIRLFGSEREEKKEELVERLLKAKEEAGVTFDDIAKKLKVTNVYAAQLFVNQAQLKAKTAEKLSAIVPGISEDDLKLMQKSPFRSFDPTIMQEPLIYRLVEAMQVFHAITTNNNPNIPSTNRISFMHNVTSYHHIHQPMFLTIHLLLFPYCPFFHSLNSALWSKYQAHCE